MEATGTNRRPTGKKLSLPWHITNSPVLPPISSTMTKIFGIQRSRSLLSHILGPSYGCMPTHFCTIWVNRAQIFVLLHSTVFAVKAFSLGLPCYLSLDCVSLVTVVRVAFCLSFSIFAIVTQNLDFRHEMSASLSAAENEEHSGKFFFCSGSN